MTRPIGIDLFSGAGGLSLGFEQAGFRIAAAVEIDPIHAAAHAFNFPECAVIPRSVEGLAGSEIREHAGIGASPVSVVFGGAPCQGFSMIGRRAFDDPRNRLVRDFVRLVDELDADYFVFENVKGITVGRHVRFLEELISEFETLGYRVALPWKVLNAADFGVPQNRERLILMGGKRTMALPEYPSPLCVPPGQSGSGRALPPGPTCGDALGDLPDADRYEDLLASDAVRAVWGEPSEYARPLRGLGSSRGDFGQPRLWDREVLTSSMRTNHTALSRRRFAATGGGDVEPVSRFFRLPEDGVSNTLRAGTDSARGAFTAPRPIHYRYARCITVREMARLHGFPDWFRFHQTKWHGARQIGNAVPPPLGKVVAGAIMAAAGHRPSVSRRGLDLGDEALLRMDMREASAHFAVPVPIASRNRVRSPVNVQENEAGERVTSAR